MEQSEANAAYCAALNAAQKAMDGRVHKGGENTHGGYRYAGHEQVLATCRSALVGAGLNVEAPTAMDGPRILEIPRGNGRSVIVWIWGITIPVSHVDGHRQYYRVEATTQANDKSAFVASTAADRTLRMRLCGLAGTNEDPEHDSHDSRDDSAPQQAADDSLGPWRQKLAQCSDAAELADWFADAVAKLCDDDRRRMGAALHQRAEQLGTSIEALKETL